MARKTSPKEVKTSTALANYDEQLAAAAGEYSTVEDAAGTGDFFGLKGGIITWGGNPVKGNTITCVIMDSVLENVYYEGSYDPESPQAPTCFAFNRDESLLAPHKSVVEAGQAVANTCAECQMNEWGSAEVGKGKACRNTRRLALLPAGELDKDGEFVIDDDEDIFSGNIGYMKLPVTSVKNYANYVKSLASTFKRPPYAVFTKITTEPDPKSQFKVIFEALALLDNDAIPQAIERNASVKDLIEFPYMLSTGEEEEAPAAKTKKKSPVKGKASGRKY